LYWKKIIINGLVAFFTTLVAVNFAGLDGNAIIAAVMGAIITAALAACNEAKQELDKTETICVPVQKRKLTSSLVIF
jgi:hypothetical protein